MSRARATAAGPVVLGGVPELPERFFDFKTQQVVLDLKAVHEFPFDPERAGTKSLRAFIFPRDRVTHVPGSPGKYVVDGDWSTETTLRLVYFAVGTQQKAELLLSFIDHGTADADSIGLSVESMPLPLLQSGKR